MPSSISASGQTRSDARTAYLDPMLSRPNLHILTGHTVTRILHGDGLFLNATWAPGASGVTVSGIEV